jgi:hypothetical protein
MEAGGNVRPFELQVLPGGRDDGPVKDRDREREEVEGVADRVKQAIKNLPAGSPWLLPLQRFLRAVREGLRRGR